MALTVGPVGHALAAPRSEHVASAVRGLAASSWALPALALLAWLALLSVALPYGADESVYTLVARGITDGRWPYRDLFDHKPPLLYAWYLPAGFGAPLPAQRLIAAAVVATSLAPFATVARRLLGERRARLAVIACAALLANPFIAVNTNAEAFVLLPLMVAIAAPSAIGAGMLFGVAVMTKSTAIAFTPLLLLAWKREAWHAAACAAAVCVLCAVPFTPVFGDFWTANVTFNVAYGDAVGASLAERLTPDPWVLMASLPLWLMAGAGLLVCRNRLAWAWLACALLAVKAPGFDFAHYYALLAPPAALLAACAIDAATSFRPAWRLAAGCALAAASLPAFALTAIALAHGFASSGPYHDVSAAVRASEGELYVLGDSPQIYVLAGREPERQFFFSVPLAVDDGMSEAARRDLLRCLPALLAVPLRNNFQPAWVGEVTKLYARKSDYGTATLYESPQTACDNR